MADGHDVCVVDDLSFGDVTNVPADAELVKADVADADAMRDVMRGAEVVFHLAAHKSVPRSLDSPLATDTANVHGTLSVLKAAADEGVRRVVYASSSSVYGGADVLPTP